MREWNWKCIRTSWKWLFIQDIPEEQSVLRGKIRERDAIFHSKLLVITVITRDSLRITIFSMGTNIHYKWPCSSIFHSYVSHNQRVNPCKSHPGAVSFARKRFPFRSRWTSCWRIPRWMASRHRMSRMSCEVIVATKCIEWCNMCIH